MPDDPPKPSTTDASNPSITERSVRHKWEGEKYLRANGNFTKWSDRLQDLLILNGLYSYVFDPLPTPEKSAEPRAYSNWIANDKVAITFIKMALDEMEHRSLVTNKGAKYCYDDLKKRAQREGPIKQIGLIREALSTYCSTTESLPATAERIIETGRRAFDIGDLTMDLFICIALLNSLNDPAFEALQNSVSTLLAGSTKENPCTPSDIVLLMENAQNIINSKNSAPGNATALAAKSSNNRRHNNRGPDMPGHNHPAGTACCENCQSLGRPCRGHTKQFCVQKGGGMQGKSIAEARAAAKGTKGKTDTKVLVAVTGLDGQTWYIDQSSLEQAPALPESTAAFAGISRKDFSTENWEYSGFMAIGDAHASINWKDYTVNDEGDKALATNICPVPQAKRAPLVEPSMPFLVDSGATVHISPRREDFISLRPISPRAVKGLGGSSVTAIGSGNIRLHVAKGADITLEDVLYIPNATVRLISVSCLTIQSGVEAMFSVCHRFP